MTFVGLDLHKRYITACALDDVGGVLGEVRRMPVSLESLLDFLSVFEKPVAVGMEATLYWQWLHDHLDAPGYTCRVADARQVRLTWQARSKNDPIDARKLGELLQVNLFPTIWIPDADTKRRRQLLHSRGFLVKQRTHVKNRIHGRLTSENLLFPRSDLYGRAGRAWLATTELSPGQRSQVDRLLRIPDAPTREIDLMDDDVKRLRRDHLMIELLHTGVDPVRWSHHRPVWCCTGGAGQHCLACARADSGEQHRERAATPHNDACCRRARGR